MRLSLFLILLLLLGWSRLSPTAQADPPTVASLRSQVVSPVTRYDFGSIISPGAEPITHAFLIRNDSDHVLTITRFVPSCHCTTAVFVPDTPLPVMLAPGAHANVLVSITVEPYLTGPLEKSVGVFAASQDAPVGTLTLDAYLRPLVAFTPAQLGFGVVHAGTTRILTLHATMPKVLISGSARQVSPTLLSSDPDVFVTPLAVSPGPASGTCTAEYRVTLSNDAALGPIQALLQFASTPGTKPESGLTLADGPGVSVIGTVQGLADATPTRLAFGIVRQGKSFTLPVIFTSPHADALAAARATTESRDIRVQWLPETAQSRILKVTLSQATPPGTVQSLVTVTLADGECLRLPVIAYVTTP
jgi:hypothetical protein